MLYEELEQKNTMLLQKLGSVQHDPKLQVKVKIEITENKLEMLKIINSEDDLKVSMNALDLINYVDGLPHIPMHSLGIKDLDFKLGGGIEIGSYVQIGGESGVGKTKLVMDIVCNVAHGHKVVFFNGEMGKRRIVTRLKAQRLRADVLKNIEIDSDTRELQDIINEVKIHYRAGYKFFMYDSKMKIKIQGVNDEIKKDAIIGEKLSELCQQYDIIFILINQMNNLDIKEKRLQLKGGGSQKYDSDLLFFYTKDENGKRTLICTKNRTGNEDLFQVDLVLGPNGKTIGVHDYQAPVETIFISDDTVNNIINDVPDEFNNSEDTANIPMIL